MLRKLLYCQFVGIVWLGVDLHRKLKRGGAYGLIRIWIARSITGYRVVIFWAATAWSPDKDRRTQHRPSLLPTFSPIGIDNSSVAKVTGPPCPPLPSPSPSPFPTLLSFPLNGEPKKFFELQMLVRSFRAFWTYKSTSCCRWFPSCNFCIFK